MIPLLFAPGLNNGGIGITAVKGVIHITYQEKHIREFKIRSCFGGGEEAVKVDDHAGDEAEALPLLRHRTL